MDPTWNNSPFLRLYASPFRNKSLFLGFTRGQMTSWTPPMCGQSTSSIWNNSLLLRLHKLVHESNPERLLVFKALWVVPWVHKSTSQTPPTRQRSTSAIRKYSWFLRLYKSVDECTSPPVKPLPFVDHPWVHIVPYLSEGTWRSSHSVTHFFWILWCQGSIAWSLKSVWTHSSKILNNQSSSHESWSKYFFFISSTLLWQHFHFFSELEKLKQRQVYRLSSVF